MHYILVPHLATHDHFQVVFFFFLMWKCFLFHVCIFQSDKTSQKIYGSLKKLNEQAIT